MNRFLALALLLIGTMAQAAERFPIEIRQVVLPDCTPEELATLLGLEVSDDEIFSTVVLQDPDQRQLLWKRLAGRKKAEVFRFHRVLVELDRSTEVKNVKSVPRPFLKTSEEPPGTSVRYEAVEVGAKAKVGASREADQIVYNMELSYAREHKPEDKAKPSIFRHVRNTFSVSLDAGKPTTILQYSHSKGNEEHKMEPFGLVHLILIP